MTQTQNRPAPVRVAAREQPPTRRGLALAIIVTCQLMLVLDATVMNVALPRIQSSLHFSSTGLSWVMSAYTLTFGGLLLLGGRAGDIFGRRRMFVGGVALFTIASLAGGLAPTAGLLIAARIAQGVGAAAAGPSTIALVTTTFTETRERVRALALLSAMSGGGFAIGLIVGGLLTELASWRWVLFINVPFGIAAVLLAPRYVREPQRQPAGLDLRGAITATVGVASLVYGFIHSATYGWSNPVTVTTLAVGVVMITVFVVFEAHCERPLLPLWLFTDRNRVAGFANFLLGPAAMMSMFFFLTQFLQDVRGFSAIATGFAFLPMAACMFGMTRVVPRLLGRFGPKPLAISGTALMVLGLSWLAQLTPTTGYTTGLLGPMLIMGLGGGLAFVPLAPVILGSVPAADAGAAGGAMQTMQQVGATLGLAILVTVYGATLRHGTGDHVRTMVSGMTNAFTVSALIACATFLVALTFRGTRRQPVVVPAPISEG
jgi:EmrB/QacA subfamily drug resistance transporter